LGARKASQITGCFLDSKYGAFVNSTYQWTNMHSEGFFIIGMLYYSGIFKLKASEILHS
jgi:hypothetical protein